MAELTNPKLETTFAGLSNNAPDNGRDQLPLVRLNGRAELFPSGPHRI
jgi:hypothetical protein